MEILTQILRGALGLTVLLAICFLLSSDRRRINWRQVGMGMLLQLSLAVLVLKVPFVDQAFEFVSSFFVIVLQFSSAGAEFLFGNIVTDMGTFGYIFAFQVLPTIIFFSALSSLLYYLGILQIIIKGFAYVMTRVMGLTGAESLAAAANIFIGQTEAPLVVRPYLEDMSRSEIACLMTGGFATIAGGVFAAYVGYLGGTDPVLQQQFATHLLAASIISAPAAIVAAKILYPETREVSLDNQKLSIPRNIVGDNILDSIARGTGDGIRLAVNVGAMLLVFTAFVAMVNYILLAIGGGLGLNEQIIAATEGRFEGLSLQYILGMIFAPVAWLIGVAWEDCLVVGQLLGLKTALNEFYAYAEMESVKDLMSQRSVIITTYALCGFANFASIGIQLGGIGALAPGQRKTLTELGIKTMIGGTIACFLTAAIAGMLI